MGFERSWVNIDLDNFSHNLRQLKSMLPDDTGFMQIVKADAYGHGAYEIALQSIRLGAAFLGVANAEEGALLRYQGIETPILILSPSFPEEIDLIIENRLTPTVNGFDFAEKLSRRMAEKKRQNQSESGSSFSRQDKIKLHIEIDTGMGRSGIRYDKAEDLICRIDSLKGIEIEGIFSHFSSSESDPEYTELQNKRFKSLLDRLNIPLKYIHIANSSGVITCSPDYANLVRIGLLSYGVYPDESFRKMIDLQPVMSFKSSICQIKTAQKDETIGYNRTFKAERDTRYAIIPVGYADGYDFLLSNKGQILIREHLCPVIGRVSMDMITVDITDFPDIEVNDEVTLLDGGDLRPENVVSLYDGLSYELLSQIGRRARRYYQRDSKIIATAPLSRRGFVSRDFSDSKLNLIIESAISQRLQSKEIAALLYSEILKRFFSDKDDNIHYRQNFKHTLIFKEPEDKKYRDFYEVETTLSFRKVLQQEFFYVACAKRYEDLEKYFRRRDVEYRWQLDENFTFSAGSFEVTAVKIDDLELSHSKEMREGCIEFKCYHSGLQELVGQEVDFSISTKTYYPKKSHQLTVYITEITRGVEISFAYPHTGIDNVEVVSILSGQSKYPNITRQENRVDVSSGKDEWIFPNSGVVIAYGTSDSDSV